MPCNRAGALHAQVVAGMMEKQQHTLELQRQMNIVELEEVKRELAVYDMQFGTQKADTRTSARLSQLEWLQTEEEGHTEL